MMMNMKKLGKCIIYLVRIFVWAISLGQLVIINLIFSEDADEEVEEEVPQGSTYEPLYVRALNLRQILPS